MGRGDVLRSSSASKCRAATRCSRDRGPAKSVQALGGATGGPACRMDQASSTGFAREQPSGNNRLCVGAGGDTRRISSAAAACTVSVSVLVTRCGVDGVPDGTGPAGRESASGADGGERQQRTWRYDSARASIDAGCALYHTRRRPPAMVPISRERPGALARPHLKTAHQRGSVSMYRWSMCMYGSSTRLASTEPSLRHHSPSPLPAPADNQCLRTHSLPWHGRCEVARGSAASRIVTLLCVICDRASRLLLRLAAQATLRLASGPVAATEFDRARTFQSCRHCPGSEPLQRCERKRPHLQRAFALALDLVLRCALHVVDKSVALAVPE